VSAEATRLQAYGRLDRLLHRMAFSGIEVQKSLADIESRSHRSVLGSIDVRRPVFVTSLPRAGTTLLLELLAQTGAFASHTYRDMPFVLCPMLWQRLSRNFRREADLRERAHGDGMMVGFDSPEALEEAIWCGFFAGRYCDDRILCWGADARDPEFESFFDEHMRKIVVLRGGQDAALRYLSKNNANVARIDLLRRLYPEAKIIVPFRRPMDHIGSLLRQHANFTALHDADPFVRDYMAALGHFEFGRLLRPIDFDGWLDGWRNDARDGGPKGAREVDGADPAFWAAYWSAMTDYVLARVDDPVLLLDYDALCEEPGRHLALLAERLEMAGPEALGAQAGRLRPQRRYEADTIGLPDEFASTLERRHEALRAAAIA